MSSALDYFERGMRLGNAFNQLGDANRARKLQKEITAQREVAAGLGRPRLIGLGVQDVPEQAGLGSFVDYSHMAGRQQSPEQMAQTQQQEQQFVNQYQEEEEQRMLAADERLQAIDPNYGTWNQNRAGSRQSRESTNQRMSSTVNALLQTYNTDSSQFVPAIYQTAEAFRNMGDISSYRDVRELAKVAETNPQLAAEQLTILQGQLAQGTGREGLASATTTTWRNGTTLFNLPNGQQKLVFQGREITDPKEIGLVINAANESGIAQAGAEAYSRAAQTAQGGAAGEVAALPDTKQVIEEKAVATKLSTELADAYSNIKSTEAGMDAFEKDIEYLKGLNEKATYTLKGRAWDAVSRELGFEASDAAIAAAEAEGFVLTNVLPQLKPTFGGAISDAELDLLRKTWGDLTKSPAEKNAQLNSQLRVSRSRLAKDRELVRRYEASQGKPQQSVPNTQAAPNAQQGKYKIEILP